MPTTAQPPARRPAAERSAEAPQWLDAEEMAAWLPLMRVMHLLPQQLDRQLREQAGINHNYYMIMVTLSAQPDRSMTLSGLAREVAMIPSRLTHALGSLEGRGWVVRRPCETDKRVQFAWLTDEGMRALEQAAPGHVAEVRRSVFDALDRRDLAHLRRIAEKIAAGLGE
jgi:DNA-binding MarR family transcriptional regulator